MNNINKNIFSALKESLFIKEGLSPDIKKFAEKFIKELSNVDFKNKSQVEDFLEYEMLEYAEDFIADAAYNVYKDYEFYGLDDSDYDRQTGYGEYITVEIERGTDNPNKQEIKELSKEIIEECIKWLSTYIKAPENIVNLLKDNQKMLIDEFEKILFDYYKGDYIEKYIETIDIDDDRIKEIRKA